MAMRFRQSSPRFYKAIRRNGAALTLISIMTWIGSGWGSCGIALSKSLALFDQGQLRIAHFRSAFGIGSEVQDLRLHPFAFDWRFSWIDVGTFWCCQFQIWPFCIVLLTTTVGAWRLEKSAQRRNRLGRCPKCGYDLKGLAAGDACPECGWSNSAWRAWTPIKQTPAPPR
jgi:hypothetical protein